MVKKIYVVTFLLSFVLSFVYIFAHMVWNMWITKSFNNIRAGNAETVIENVFPGRGKITELYGLTNKVLSPKIIDRIVKERDGYLISLGLPIDNTDYASRKLAELRDFCEKKNIQFAYISYPSKADSSNYGAVYGIDYRNEELREKFLSKLNEHNISVLDIRKQLEREGLNRREIFYKTDHHWNTRSGLFAARSIINFLHDKGNSTKPANLNADNFTYTDYNDCWFGETGRKCSFTWVGSLDDFTIIKPKYNTSFDYIVPNEFNKMGDFSLLINESLFEEKIDIYSTSLHYSYMPGANKNTIVKNNTLENGAKILIIKDSFSIVVVPFLSLGCGEINMWDMRGNEESVYEYIQNNDFDIVLVAYTDYFTDEMYNFF